MYNSISNNNRPVLLCKSTTVHATNRLYLKQNATVYFA